MAETDVQELLNKNLVIVEELRKKASVFSKSTLILSLLDVIFGVLAIFCSSLTVTSVLLSASSLTAISICGKIIQVSKIRQLEKSLRTLNLISIAWFVNKYKKYLKEKKVKMTKSTVLQKILTSIIAVFGVGGIVVGILPQFTDVAAQVTNIVSLCSEAIAVISGIWLSGTSDKVLSQDEVAKLEKEKLEKERAKRLQKAKAVVEQYEQAKAIVEESKVEKE